MTSCTNDAIKKAIAYLELVKSGATVSAEKNMEMRDEALSGLKSLDAGQVAKDKFLMDGARFKMLFDDKGKVTSFWNCREVLEGRWVALVAAEDGCHLKTE